MASAPLQTDGFSYSRRGRAPADRAVWLSPRFACLCESGPARRNSSAPRYASLESPEVPFLSSEDHVPRQQRSRSGVSRSSRSLRLLLFDDLENHPRAIPNGLPQTSGPYCRYGGMMGRRQQRPLASYRPFRGDARERQCVQLDEMQLARSGPSPGFAHATAPSRTTMPPWRNRDPHRRSAQTGSIPRR